MPSISTISSSASALETSITTNSVAADSSAATSSSPNDDNDDDDDDDVAVPPLVLDKLRLTSSAKGKSINNQKKRAKYESAAVKQATKMYYDELQKPEGEVKLSAREIEKVVRKRFNGVGPSARTITRYVNEYSLVNSSPVRRGNPGLLPFWVFESLCVALESFISINQVNQNCQANTKKNLSARVNAVFGREETGSRFLLDRIVRERSIDLQASMLHSMEARRIQ